MALDRPGRDVCVGRGLGLFAPGRGGTSPTAPGGLRRRGPADERPDHGRADRDDAGPPGGLHPGAGQRVPHRTAFRGGLRRQEGTAPVRHRRGAIQGHARLGQGQARRDRGGPGEGPRIEDARGRHGPTGPRPGPARARPGRGAAATDPPPAQGRLAGGLRPGRGQSQEERGPGRGRPREPGPGPVGLPGEYPGRTGQRRSGQGRCPQCGARPRLLPHVRPDLRPDRRGEGQARQLRRPGGGRGRARLGGAGRRPVHRAGHDPAAQPDGCRHPGQLPLSGPRHPVGPQRHPRLNLPAGDRRGPGPGVSGPGDIHRQHDQSDHVHLPDQGRSRQPG